MPLWREYSFLMLSAGQQHIEYFEYATGGGGGLYIDDTFLFVLLCKKEERNWNS